MQYLMHLFLSVDISAQPQLALKLIWEFLLNIFEIRMHVI